MKIISMTTPFILNITVNCYLAQADGGFVLIDTAKSGSRRLIENALDDAGCKPGDLRLIVLTHGDFDHCGNAAYLAKKFGVKIAMHEADIGMVERGDMVWNRKKPNFLMGALMRLLFRLDEADRFTPDFFIREDDTLAAYGFDAEVIEIPGHSKGSIGLLASDGDLFCGDLLGNTRQPDLWTIMDDRETAKASVEKLKDHAINRVYPGHGQPFAMAEFLSNFSPNQPEPATNRV